MSLTADVKDELARVRVEKIPARKAEVAATLRFAGGLHIISGHVVIEAELDLHSTFDAVDTGTFRAVRPGADAGFSGSGTIVGPANSNAYEDGR